MNPGLTPIAFASEWRISASHGLGFTLRLGACSAHSG